MMHLRCGQPVAADDVQSRPGRLAQRSRARLLTRLLLQEAFQVLVLTRMLIRRESEYRGGTEVTYALGPDARAAQTRGDVTALVARRLPD